MTSLLGELAASLLRAQGSMEARTVHSIVAVESLVLDTWDAEGAQSSLPLVKAKGQQRRYQAAPGGVRTSDSPTHCSHFLLIKLNSVVSYISTMCYTETIHKLIP